MTINDYIRWGNVPEFVLNNLWHLEIEDGPNPFPHYRGFMTEQMLDYSISEINIPQESIEIDKTTFGLPTPKGMNNYENVTITYYDYVVSPIGGVGLPVTKFFQMWLDTIYDREKRCIKNNWRYHSKSIKATLSRYYTKGPLSSFVAGVANQGISYANTFINKPLGIDIGLKIPKVNFDVKNIDIITYDIQNCYPIKLDEITLDNDSGDRKSFSVELICERVNNQFKGGLL